MTADFRVDGKARENLSDTGNKSDVGNDQCPVIRVSVFMSLIKITIACGLWMLCGRYCLFRSAKCDLSLPLLMSSEASWIRQRNDCTYCTGNKVAPCQISSLLRYTGKVWMWLHFFWVFWALRSKDECVYRASLLVVNAEVWDILSSLKCLCQSNVVTKSSTFQTKSLNAHEEILKRMDYHVVCCY